MQLKANNKRIKKEFSKRLLMADVLVIISFLILFFTTFMINIYVAMYLLATFTFILSYFIQKGR